MKLTIITINRNNAAGLRRTLESTFAGQPGFDDWEQIVVDGASTDGSFEVLDKWKDNPHLGWHVSEPDTGIYNAMNKGAGHARGDYLLFLNSGDILLPDSLQRLFGGQIQADLVVSNMTVDRAGTESPYYETPPDRIDPVYFLFRTLPHQGTLISRALHEQFGGYDTGFRFAGDLDFFVRCFTKGSPSVQWVPEPFSEFFTNGVSYQAGNRQTVHDEWARCLEPHFGKDTASRAGLKMEDRPWIRDDIAIAAYRDRNFARCLRLAIRTISELWKFPPTRFLLRSVSWLARQFGK